jgi:leucyl/phenylalanyl-tRNA--protein transferase
MIEDPLNPNVLLIAYSQGLFPMPHPVTEQVQWYCPDPRAVIPLDGLHVSTSMRKVIRQTKWVTTFDEDFVGVMRACADRKETWINEDFVEAYKQLHELGFAHSVEIREPDGKLVGGVYGVAIGKAFFAESMFHRATNASKYAIIKLVEEIRRQEFKVLEVQFLTPHLRSLGAVEIPAREYLRSLKKAVREPSPSIWQSPKNVQSQK